MLEGRQLECVRGGRRLFRGLDLMLEAGGCIHVAGRNGAGKTSLLRILAGLLPPTEGAVLWEGRPLARVREEFGAALAFVGHLNGVKDDLTALENVCFEERLRGLAGDEQAGMAALSALDVAAFADVPARHLSQGQKRRVALCRLAASAPPRLWILDEPFNALDARSVEVLQGMLEAQLGRGGMVVLTAHQGLALPAGTRTVALEGAS